MKLTNSQLKILLLGANIIPYEKIEKFFKEAEEQGMPIEEYLPTTGLISSEQLAKIIAGALKYDYINLKKQKIDEQSLNMIPESMARGRGIVIFGKTESYIKVGMLDPDDVETIHFVKKISGCEVSPFYITKKDLEIALAKYRGNIHDKFNEILSDLKDPRLSPEEKDKTTIRVVDILMQFGYECMASDIHVEPYKNNVLIRFRIDGVLHDMLKMPKELQEYVLSRIKILSKMRTDEHRAAQDGKFRFALTGKNENIDVRVSIIPISNGEKIVMRLLSSKSREYSLNDIGLSDANSQKIYNAIKNPHGMILVTGPTGSGKTTTVYSVLKILNKREVNIASIEDPVEYDVEGINQIQVNTKTNLTFASGLRSILRQDPDIIMIGEIRDEETASIAINSALTGHLVLSTLHTNDAVTTLPRLLDMGIEPFLVSSTVNIAIAQRLVRQICPMCKVSHKIDASELKIIERDPVIKKLLEDEGYSDLTKLRLYSGQGCDVCSYTGYTTRIGIFEIIEMTESIRDLVVKRASSDELLEVAKQEGMTTMLQDGVHKSLMGVTTLMEVLRVTTS